MASAGIKTNGTGTAGVFTFGGTDSINWDAGGAYMSPLSANAGTFDLALGHNFTCTPTGSITLTFSGITGRGGKSGTIMLVNSSNYSVSKAATTKSDGNFTTNVSASGTYRLTYYCDGTNVYINTSLAQI